MGCINTSRARVIFISAIIKSEDKLELQKGTIGILLPGVDMPFNKYGVRPDIILNPNAIPSRMTIGQLVECLVGKTAVLQGMDADGTPFEEYDIESIKDKLQELGYERNGKEYLYNGMTGEKMKVEIFIGPTFYQRLKHLVEDKLHCLKEEHEVLTSVGWVPIKEVTREHLVACLINGELSWNKPTNILHYPDYEGEIYTIDSDFVKLEVTGEHRMWAKLEGENDFMFHLARDLYGKNALYLTMNENNKCVEIDGTSDMTERITHEKVPVYCLEVPGEIFYVRDMETHTPVWTANSRARGPKTSLTRQAPEGRSRDGGLRLGEMERDALLGHGTAKFLKEKLLDNSDPYTTFVCGKCGLFAQRFNRKEDKHYSTDNDIYFCPPCNNFTDIHKVKIPYAFKLFCQELMSMAIAPRIRFHKDIYNS